MEQDLFVFLFDLLRYAGFVILVVGIGIFWHHCNTDD